MKAEFLLIVSIVGESSYMQLDYYYDASMKKPIVNLQISRTWEGGQEYITRGGGLSNNLCVECVE